MRRVLIATVLLALAVPAGADPTEHISTLADQRSVNVTIYNQDLALVREERHVRLPKGLARLALRDVSAQMQPETALFRSLTEPGAIDIVEQDFNFDLLSPDKLLEKYTGRTVTIIHTNPKTGEHTRESAKVLATNSGVVLRYADRIETSIDGTIAFPSIPGDLRDRPTLTIDVDNEHAGPQNVELTYLTGGMSWRADYVGGLSADSKFLDLAGSVTLQNASGTAYPNASLQLVAGDVNVASSAPRAQVALQTIARTTTRGAAEVSDLADYHLYTLPRRTTIADRQIKQIALLSAHAIPVTKTLELRGSPSYYGNTAGDLGDRLAIGSYLTFTNDKGDLGIPLPAGTVRIYQNDVHGHAQFIGLNTIAHTPKGETVRLYLGNSFDVTAHKKQTDFRVIDSAPRIVQTSYEITLRNAKATPVTVLVVEPIPGDWTIETESAPHVKSSSHTATWTLVVPPNGSTVLTYTASVHY